MHFLKNKKFMFSFLVMAALLVVSIYYTMHFQKEFKPVPAWTDKDGIPVGPPFTPQQLPPFGSDKLGYPILTLLIRGAKYTIGIAVLVAFLRLIIGLIVGIGLTVLPIWLQKGITQLLSPFQYLPVSLLSYLLLANVLISTNTMQPDFTGKVATRERMIFEFLLLAIVGAPTLLIYFKDITQQYLEEEHITAARVLGASSWGILRKHVWLGIKDRVAIQYVEQVIQVLALMVHLGMFELLFGGTIVHIIPIPMSQDPPIFQSVTSEWSGLIGSAYHDFELIPRLTLIPLVAFASLIFLFNLMRDGMKEALSYSNLPKSRQKKASKKRKKEKGEKIKEVDFTPYSEREAG